MNRSRRVITLLLSVGAPPKVSRGPDHIRPIERGKWEEHGYDVL